jgi:hypothetical protein
MPSMSRFLAPCVLALALPAAAQQVVPATDYTDMWWNPNESGWGISFMQHSGTGRTNQVLAVWYAYDPREPDSSSAATADFKPIWLVMPGGTWTTPSSITGDVYATTGTPYLQAWNANGLAVQRVGSFTFSFTTPSSGTFTYSIAPPAGLAAGNPGFGLPTLTGSKPIERQVF